MVVLNLIAPGEVWSQQRTTTVQVFIQYPKSDTGSNATIHFYLLPDSVQKGTQLQKLTGNTFTCEKYSKYLVEVSCMGYISEFKTVNVADKPVTVFIPLKKQAANLKEVVVVSRKPLLRQEGDKTIVEAGVLSASSTNAFEMLEKTPGTIVDQDGYVYLNSMTPASVYINGQEIKMGSQELASLLKSLPSGSISRIEIIRTPSARFDAAAAGGVVNIVLKRGVKLGTNGSINAGYFQGVYSTKTAGINFNTANGKLSSYINYQFSKRNNYEELISLRTVRTDTSVLNQEAFTTYPSSSNFLNGGITYTIGKKLSIGYDQRISYTLNNNYTTNVTSITKAAPPATLGKNDADIHNDNKSLYNGSTVSSRIKIDTLGSEWSTEIGYNYYRNDNMQNYTSTFSIPLKPDLQGYGDIVNKRNIWVTQSDLILKSLNNYTIESGIKYTINNTRNNAIYFYRNGNTAPWITDNYQTNSFRYTEKITAIYMQVSRTLKGFTIKPGVRMEVTDIRGHQLIPKDTTFSLRRTDLFPYIFISHKLFKMFDTDIIGNIVFRKSIKRPFYELLSPSPRYVDQYLYDVGNPSLKPQFTTNYEFNASFSGFPVFAIGYNVAKDVFANVIYPNDVTRVAYRTYDNLGKNKEFYFRVTGGIPPGGNYFFYAGIQHNRNSYTGVYGNQLLSYARGTTAIFMFHECKFRNTLSMNMQGFIRTKGLQSLIEIGTLGALYLSINKSLFNKKANLLLSFSDLFKTNKVSYRLNQGNVFSSGNRANDTRRIGLTFRFNFGVGRKNNVTQNFGDDVEPKEE
jgi:hypothetical protein